MASNFLGSGLHGGRLFFLTLTLLALSATCTSGRKIENHAINGEAASGTPSLSVKASIGDGVANLEFTWAGTATTDLLVVSFDSNEAAETRSMRVEPGIKYLFGIVLVRTVDGDGSATLRFHYPNMTDYLWDETVLATVYLVSELDLHILEGDTSVMGGERVTEVVKVTHGDAGREFQLVCESEDRNLIERIIPTAAFMQTGTVEGKRCASVVRETSVKAISTVIID